MMDLIGFAAAACGLATFCMQSMRGLRAFAIASNVLFIVYGAQANLLPIVALHGILLPINGWSLGRMAGGDGAALALGTVFALASATLICCLETESSDAWKAFVGDLTRN